ncbi:MAG: Omp28-related outer membrane protein [Bacteroidaceae bacterium]|nr:Omp28-related outer membrane protein [Bacteroidaceae bacterium]
MVKQLLTLIAALLLAVNSQAKSIEPGSNQIWWGYFNESDFEVGDYLIGTGSPMSLMTGIYVPAGHEQLKASTIKAVRVYLDGSVVSNLSNMKIWISKSLPSKVDDADYVQATTEALVGGANDFMLDTPYNIGNEGFYIGYHVSSSTGYFIKCGGTDVANSFWIGNPSIGMNWQDLNGNGLGKLAFQVLVEGGNFSEYCATAEDFKPTVVGLGETVDIPVDITNMGTATLNEISYTVTADGKTSEEKTISSLSVPYGAQKTVSIPVQSASKEGTYVYTLTITKVNGNINAASKNTATGKVTTVTELKTWPRNVLIEEFTTEYCGYCPEAASELASFINNYPEVSNHVAVVCHHAGFYTDWLTIPASESYTWFYNSGGTYAPAFMYDRYAWDGMTPVEGRSSAAGYKKRVEARMAEPSYANIVLDANFNDGKTEIMVTCECERGWDFSSSPARLTLFLTEDNVTARSQSGASGTFIHQHVLRSVNSTWGSVLSWQDNKATYTYTFTLDSAWKTDDLKVIAFISGYDSSDATNCVVENVAFTVPSEIETGISSISLTNETTADFYSIDGRKRTTLEKGINIVRMPNGTVKKVFVK